MGVIFQDFMRYEMTVKENIGVGHVEVPHTEQEIESAAQKSLAAEVVKKLAGGYDQMLGRRFVSGVISPAASGSGLPWRALICAMPSCSSSTSRPRLWTQKASWKYLSDLLS